LIFANLLGYCFGVGATFRRMITAWLVPSMGNSFTCSSFSPSFLMALPASASSSFAAMPPTDTLHYVNHGIYNAQNDIILELGQKSDCIIVGRCADYILEDYKPYNIFVYADMESRLERCRAKGGRDAELSDKELQKKIQSIDKSRAQYYRFYTGKTWGDRYNYDLCINTSGKDIGRLAKAIAYTINNK